jgi:hypothetical protein
MPSDISLISGRCFEMIGDRLGAVALTGDDSANDAREGGRSFTPRDKPWIS